MSQILIEEARYIELLKYEARIKKQTTEPKKHVNNKLLIEAIEKGIKESPVGGESKTYDKVIRPFFVELYGDRAGIRARQKAWKDGITKLAEDGIINIEPSHAGMFLISLVAASP